MLTPVSASMCAGGQVVWGQAIDQSWVGGVQDSGGLERSFFSISPSVKSVNAGLSCAADAPNPKYYELGPARTITPPLRTPTRVIIVIGLQRQRPALTPPRSRELHSMKRSSRLPR